MMAVLGKSFINMLLCFADMSNSNQTNVTVDEELPLNTIPGSGDTQNNATCFKQDAETFRHDKHHRKLAICSIICGISCIGIKALINSVKVFVCIFNAISGVFFHLSHYRSRAAPACALCSKLQHIDSL